MSERKRAPLGVSPARERLGVCGHHQLRRDVLVEERHPVQPGDRAVRAGEEELFKAKAKKDSLRVRESMTRREVMPRCPGCRPPAPSRGL